MKRNANIALLQQTNMLLKSELHFANERVRQLMEENIRLKNQQHVLVSELIQLETYVQEQPPLRHHLQDTPTPKKHKKKRRPTLVDTGHVTV